MYNYSSGELLDLSTLFPQHGIAFFTSTSTWSILSHIASQLFGKDQGSPTLPKMTFPSLHARVSHIGRYILEKFQSPIMIPKVVYPALQARLLRTGTYLLGKASSSRETARTRKLQRWTDWAHPLALRRLGSPKLLIMGSRYFHCHSVYLVCSASPDEKGSY